jgi:FdrA protein
VLGEGAHPDPAGELAPAIHELRDRRPELEMVVIVIGTDSDMQQVESQVARLEGAGALVFRTVTEALDHIARRVPSQSDGPGVRVAQESLDRPLAAINVGLESFYLSLVGQGARAVHVDWRPPAGGNEKLAALLARMKKTSNQ